MKAKLTLDGAEFTATVICNDGREKTVELTFDMDDGFIDFPEFQRSMEQLGNLFPRIVLSDDEREAYLAALEAGLLAEAEAIRGRQ